MNNNNSQKGFTLVELSIVLVIIGLLIGGLLVAQSMITTTKIQSFARQIGQSDAAVANFLDKYRRYPGDSSKLYSAAGGDDDGVVEASAAATWTGETTEFWASLSVAGFKGEENPITGYTATPAYVGQFPFGAPNAPKAKIGTDAGIIAIGAVDAAIFSTAAIVGDINMYVVANCTAMTSTTLSCINGMDDATGIAVDTKIDDGVGTTGNVVATTSGAAIVTWAGLHGATEGAYDPTTGSTLNTTTGTVLAIRVMTQTGTAGEAAF